MPHGPHPQIASHCNRTLRARIQCAPCRSAQRASQPIDSSPCTALGTLASFQREGATILLVEQNVNSTLEITDKAYILETGRITLQGRGKVLLENPYIKKAYLGLSVIMPNQPKLTI